MKKVVLLIIAFISVLPSTIKAQEELGQNYVKLQFIQPLGEYKDFYSSGFGAEFGRMFPFNFDIADGLIIPGLDITFINTTFNTGKEYNYNPKDEYLTTKSGLLWDLSVKLGPMVTIGITDGLVADFAVQYDPTVVFSLGRKGLDPDKFRQEERVYKEKSASSVSFAHRVSIKGDIRYTHFLFGLEFVLGGTSLNYNHEIIPENDDLTDEVSLGLGTLLLNFGFTF
ncbi:MAG: hypothetical protein IJ681_04265 [Bacteroidales bacterium]|nr:hypothetical protein [Bacteroidales bacterium]